jgi:23S rRNA (adenine2503-C2)-methyltransferase
VHRRLGAGNVRQVLDVAHALTSPGGRPNVGTPDATVSPMDRMLLSAQLAACGEPPYRAAQVWRWAARGAAGYEEMTNLPASLRTELERQVPFSTLEVEREAHARDGTAKTLFRTHDGHPVEAVLMRYRDGRRSLCLSSQSGCPLTCTFCATGQMAFGRNLTASEIVDQALHFRRIEPVDHAVFMGMGEPMLNLDAVLEAARALPDVGITNRRTTISTVGWLPGLRRFADEVEEPLRLALSLHAPSDELRTELMPVNARYPLADVLAECARYYELRHHKVFVEYVLLAGVNDRVEQARALAALLDPKVFKVNLIPYNPTGMFTGSTRKAIAAFKDVLTGAGVPATVRLTRGRDIAAACGQLAAG